MKKYILLGKINSDWIGRQKERVDGSKAKVAELGINIKAIYYTQGDYDFVDVIEAADASAALTFSIWFAKQGYGRITTMPAFDIEDMEAATSKA
jgi:uncharacterized protein with GYD domain